jgi:hypothetical protein
MVIVFGYFKEINLKVDQYLKLIKAQVFFLYGHYIRIDEISDAELTLA